MVNQNTTLLLLPDEVIAQIFKSLDKRSLLSLSLANKRLCFLSQRRLFASIYILVNTNLLTMDIYENMTPQFTSGWLKTLWASKSQFHNLLQPTPLQRENIHKGIILYKESQIEKFINAIINPDSNVRFLVTEIAIEPFGLEGKIVKTIDKKYRGLFKDKSVYKKVKVLKKFIKTHLIGDSIPSKHSHSKDPVKYPWPIFSKLERCGNYNFAVGLLPNPMYLTLKPPTPSLKGLTSINYLKLYDWASKEMGYRDMANVLTEQETEIYCRDLSMVSHLTLNSTFWKYNCDSPKIVQYHSDGFKFSNGYHGKNFISFIQLCNHMNSLSKCFSYIKFIGEPLLLMDNPSEFVLQDGSKKKFSNLNYRFYEFVMRDTTRKKDFLIFRENFLKEKVNYIKDGRIVHNEKSVSLVNRTMDERFVQFVQGDCHQLITDLVEGKRCGYLWGPKKEHVSKAN